MSDRQMSAPVDVARAACARVAADAALTSRAGSGVVVRHRGAVRVLTAAHVAAFAGAKNSLRVELASGATTKGRVVGVHHALDLAIVHVADDFMDDFMDVAMDVAGDARVGDAVRAYGTAQRYAAATAACADLVRARRRGGRVLATHGSTHAMHDARVVAGQSGGALVRERDGKLLGVHSFGDAFWGGRRDVCVLVNEATLDAIEIARDGVAPEVLATARVNAMIFRSSDEALKRMAPELSARQRASWIF